MKIFGTVILSLFFATAAFGGDTWYPAIEGSFTWDPVTVLEDGTTAAAGEIAYRLYIKNEKTGITTEAGEVANPPVALKFEMDGKNRVGVKTLRIVDGEIVSASKNIAWSDDPIYCEGNETFGFTSWLRPADTKELRLPAAPEQK